jgi:3-isopropylmalate dehydrogenase
VEVLDAMGDKFGHTFNYVELVAGGRAIDESGEPLPAEVLEAVRACDALLLGAVGGPKWDTLPGHLRPERALLGLRSGLGVYANLRPAALLPQLKAACPIKDEVLAASHHEGKATFDLLIVRELTGGLYFGERGRSADGSSAFEHRDLLQDRDRAGPPLWLRGRPGTPKKLCVVDKANVLESSRLWREVAKVVSADYPDVETSYMYVDNCAMQLIPRPRPVRCHRHLQLFGDILSDEASVLTGSIGMLASASLGDSSGGKTMGMYEPIHGSAPDIAGKDLANPLATILSAAMLLRHSFGLEKEAAAIEAAVNAVLDAGYRTRDIASRGGSAAAAAEKIVGTREMGAKVLEFLTK